MKVKAILLVFLLITSLSIPLSITLSPAKDGTFIVSIDVCSTQGNSIPSNSHTAYICPVTAPVNPDNGIEFMDHVPECLSTYIIAYRLEHPPRIRNS
ncbi:hypothetical protein BMS3Abin07_02505 [bacterium BMS3Abin07]|nr:hypothetical protein BMS3Abin07_02505 [bacterium BMS3Abin07]GBE31186.1 hypothetical protein BMS3Bbin05_00083 [bacterium BMS3Bbin05]